MAASRGAPLGTDTPLVACRGIGPSHAPWPEGPKALVMTALWLEAKAVGGKVAVVGVGPRRALARIAAIGPSVPEDQPIAVTGVAGALAAGLQPGDVVVANELRTVDGRVIRTLPGAELLAAELARVGLNARTGPIVSSSSVVRSPAARKALARDGAIAVDMESAFIAQDLPRRPMAVVRAIADTGTTGMVRGGLSALRSLRQVRGPIDQWAGALGAREVLLAAPRSFCAGVDRAIEIVERALQRFGSPVYVRRQIVHNSHVVRRLESLGASFVHELDEVPDGAVVVLAAHGVSPQIRAEAAARGTLTVIDATCPLVAKVHHEARRYAGQDFRIVLIGHADHEEVAGTIGEAPDQIELVQHASDVDALRFGAGERIAFLTQTTLATDETDTIIDALRARFPTVTGPHGDDICYATQNRQDAVRVLAQRCDLVLVIGSPNSSNTARLVEVARREGCRAELLEDASELRLQWLHGARRLGLTAGASAPEALVQQVLDTLGPLGPITVGEHRTTEETVRFSLPQQVR